MNNIEISLCKMEVKLILDLMVKKGYLDLSNGGYIDSEITNQMLKDGLNRQEISYVLENEWKIKKELEKEMK